MKDRFLTLAIESSCDETAAAVLDGGRVVLSNIISSQIPIHEAYGGVVPEIASRKHLENVNQVVERALSETGVTWNDIDLIGVTHGPGLIGALVIGVAAAKGYSLARNIPLVGVNHMYGHVCGNFLTYPDLEPPFICLVVSGGHTNIVRMTDYTHIEVLGSTRDDAVGEAYDKVARVIGLGYPGGPKIDKLAKSGDPNAIQFKRVYLEKDSLDFSFSGIKTQVLNYVNSERQAGREINTADIAAGFQEAVVEVLVNKAIEAVKIEAENIGESITGESNKYAENKDLSVSDAGHFHDNNGVDSNINNSNRGHNVRRLVVAGGVAANSRLREALSEACERGGIELYLPEKSLCTDNAAMIGSAAYYKYIADGADNLTLDAFADLPF